MKADEVIIVRTGTANLASILSAFTRLNVAARVADDRRQVELAKRLVLPGVGAFGAAIQHLVKADLIEPLCARIREGRATLAICLGMQVLFEESEESSSCRGIGALPGRVGRFMGELRVPHLGWNRISPSTGCRVIEEGYAYFANSYRVLTAPHGWSVATAEYGGRFAAALERGNVIACQFHPELSGEFGLRLIRRWIQGDRGKEGASC